MSADHKKLEAYDNTLLAILQHEAGVEPFLDVIFGFLSRRTDFYHVMTEPKQKYGFPDGVAEKIIEKYFKKYQQIVKNAQTKAEESKKIKEELQKSQNYETEEKVKTQEPDANVDLKKESETNSSKQIKILNEDGLPNQDAFQSQPESYNGATTEKYSWSQNYDDIDVQIPVEKSVSTAKQVSIEIKRHHLMVKVKNNPGDDYDVIVDNKLEHEVNREESMWSLEKGKNIVITLTKEKNIWWTKLVDVENPIDIQKICPERSMADMDQEEKAVINKLQFDEKQKRLGLPQSHELKVHEMLKKGWDVEGSPFQGQTFDPKMFNISPGAVQK